jgi:hypothetical protein
VSRGADGSATMPHASASKSDTTNRKGYHPSKLPVALQVRSAPTRSDVNAKANDINVSNVQHRSKFCSLGAVSAQTDTCKKLGQCLRARH